MKIFLCSGSAFGGHFGSPNGLKTLRGRSVNEAGAVLAAQDAPRSSEKATRRLRRQINNLQPPSGRLPRSVKSLSRTLDSIQNLKFPKPKSQIHYFNSPIPNCQIPNPKFHMQHSKFLDLKSQVPNPKSEIPNPKTKYPNSQIQNAENKSPHCIQPIWNIPLTWPGGMRGAIRRPSREAF